MSINEGLWSAKMPNGDVRSGTLNQLSEAFRAGHIGEGTLVRAAGSENWIRLADVLGGAAAFAAPVAAAVPLPSAPPPTASVLPSPARTNGTSELWQVRLPSGEVRSGTRQQLEEAFRVGHLDHGAQALAPGAREWGPLGNLLRPTQPPLASVPPMAYQPASAAPPRPASPPQSSAPSPSAPPSATPELWQVRLANGQVKSGTRQQLEEAFQAGHLDDAALVLPAGASQWIRLGSLLDRRPPAPMAAPEPAPLAAAEPAPEATAAPAPVATEEPSTATESAPATESTPHAGLAPEAETASEERASSETEENQQDLWQVRLTFKQLQEAFHARLLDDDTQVLAAGAEEWVPLGEVRRGLPPPFGSALQVPMGDALTATVTASSGFQASATHPEPASRTEPWPATMPTNTPGSD